MKVCMAALPARERAMLALRGLYEGFGYHKYNMSQFEEYSFYVQYKSFLPSDKILSFTDLDGRLMALKPDVTPSIIKNVKEGAPKRKVYYTETVYRENRQSNTLREIHQMGLECIGALTLYDVCETVLLAKESLGAVSPNHVLELGHMGYVTGLLQALNAPAHAKDEILSCIAAKSPHLVLEAAEKAGLSASAGAQLTALCHLAGDFCNVLEQAKALCQNAAMTAALTELSCIGESLAAAEQANLRLDFTLLNDTAFYDGVLLAGYVEGISRAVLSGGRYDGMMQALGKSAGAMGFAVYLSELDFLDKAAPPPTFDVVLVQDDDDVPAVLQRAAQAAKAGKRVCVVQKGEEIPAGTNVLRVTKEGVNLC